LALLSQLGGSMRSITSQSSHSTFAIAVSPRRLTYQNLTSLS
jgi:hypothetical protein